MTSDDFRFLRDARSRRSFFRVTGLTLAGGSAVFVAACGDDDDEEPASAGADTGGSSADVKILNSALDLELAAVAAYTAGASLLKGDALEVGKQFLAHEQEHADGLTGAIKQLGGTPNKAKTKDQYAEQLGLSRLKDQRDVLEFAVDLENMAIAAYVDAIPRLSSAELRQTGASIVSNEAEHVSVLIGALDPGDPAKQVPDAFVTGKA